MERKSHSAGTLSLGLLTLGLFSIGTAIVGAVPKGSVSAATSKHDFESCSKVIVHGQYEEVVTILEKHPELCRARHPKANETLLHWIAVYGDHRRVESDAEAMVISKLIECGADVDAYNGMGQTPLMEVARNHRWRIATQLLDAGANPAAQKRSFPERAELDCSNPGVMDIAASSGFAKLVARLLEMRVPIEYPESIPKPGYPPSRRSALHWCCMRSFDRGREERKKQRLATIDLLCDKISDVNLIDILGRTPLLVASDNLSDEIVEHLLTKYPKVDVNAVDHEWNSGLHLAVSADSAEAGCRIVQLLLKHGADPDLRNSNEETPLDIARRRKEKLLIDALSGK
jgi:ankyrin repeat protein